MIKEVIENDLVELQKINDFLKKSKNSEYTQNIKWNHIRNEKNKYYLYCENCDSEILWVCNLLEKERGGERYIYAPRGPVLDYSDEKVLKIFFEQITLWMLNKGYQKLVMNPCIDYDVLSIISKVTSYSLVERDNYEMLLDSCKLAIMNIDKNEDAIIKKLPSKFRQNTRRSYRKKLKSKISKDVDFDNFYKLYIQTSQRHNFNPHSIDYFKKIYDEFYEELIFLEVWYENMPLAMSMDLVYNDKLIYLYGVSSSENRNLLGMYNMQWEAIKYCIRNKIKFYDFGGVFCEENDLNNKDYGLYKFKKGYCYDGFIDVVPDIIIDLNKDVIV